MRKGLGWFGLRQDSVGGNQRKQRQELRQPNEPEDGEQLCGVGIDILNVPQVQALGVFAHAPQTLLADIYRNHTALGADGFRQLHGLAAGGGAQVQDGIARGGRQLRRGQLRG